MHSPAMLYSSDEPPQVFSAAAQLSLDCLQTVVKL